MHWAQWSAQSTLTTRPISRLFFFIFFILIAFISVPSLYAQNPNNLQFQKIPVNRILNTFMQDSDGFIWIGMQSGLYKYDGYHFKLYEAGTGDLNSNWISALYEDSKGIIWIGTSSGISTYNKNNNQFQQYHHLSSDPYSLSSSDIQLFKLQAFAEDNQQRLWIGTASGLNRFDRKNQRFIRYGFEDVGLTDGDIWAITTSKDGFLWIGTANGLHKFDPLKEIVVEQYPSEDAANISRITNNPTTASHRTKNIVHQGLSGRQFSALLEDSQGDIFVASRDGLLHKLDPQSKIITRIKTPFSNAGGFIDILEDNQQQIWVSNYGGGIGILNPERTNIVVHNYDVKNPKGISGSQTVAMHKDPQGAIWVAEFSGTLNRYDPFQHQFTAYEHQPTNDNSLSKSSYIGQLAEDPDGIFWVAVAGIGIDRYDPNTHTFTHYNHDPKNPNSLPESFGQSLIVDSEGRLWISTVNFICEFDRNRKEVEQCLETSEWPSFPIEDINDPNIIWFGSWGVGIIRLDKKKYELSYIRHDPNNPKQSLSSDASVVIYQDQEGIIWAGTFGGGLNLYDPKSNQVIAQYRFNKSDASSLSSNTVLHVYQDSKSRIWISTDTGLNLFDKTNKSFIRFNNSLDNFPLSSVSAIIEDDSGMLWIGGNHNGTIIKFDPETGNYTSFNESHGIHPGTSIAFRAIKAKDGSLWFVGYGGLTHFFPQEIKQSDYNPPIYFTSVTQGGKVLNPDVAFEYTKNIQLDWDRNFFEFSVVALNYRSAKNNQYRWKLEGVDKEWFEAGNIRHGRYSGLPSGNYQLAIQASNNDGIWSQQTTNLIVKVNAAFWQTLWFKISLSILIITSIAVTIALRFRLIQKNRQLLEQEVILRTQELKQSNAELTHQKDMAEIANQSKSEFLANMSHELRTPLNGILGYTQILLHDRQIYQNRAAIEGLNVILSSGEYLLNLINDILDLAKIEAGKITLTPAEFNLSSSINNIITIIELKAADKSLKFNCYIDPILPDNIICDERRLRQVLLNLLGNALKFTDKGSISLRVLAIDAKPDQSTKSIQNIRFEVTDTGIGLSQEQQKNIFNPFVQVGDAKKQVQGTGLGLAISTNFIQTMGSKLHVNSQSEKGSTFWFDLALNISINININESFDSDKNVIAYKGKRRSILIADDHESNREVLKGLLAPLGFQIFEATDGQDAINKANDHYPDIICMDIKMPVIDGIKATKVIRKNPLFDDIAIFAVTASVYESDIDKLISAGCTDFLPKPIHENMLLKMLSDSANIEWIYDDGNILPDEINERSEDVNSEILNSTNPIKTDFHSSTSILIADDNPVNQTILSHILKLIIVNVDITIVDNGELAVTQAKNKFFDIIFMDKKMPVMNGILATKEIRKFTSDVPIYGISAENVEAELKLFIEAGCNGYLEKPFRKENIRKALLKHIHHKNIYNEAAVNSKKTGK